MNEKDVVREIMKERGWSQTKLAEECQNGWTQSNITGLLNNGKRGMRMDKLAVIMRALGCEIIIRDKMGSGKEWKIS